MSVQLQFTNNFYIYLATLILSNNTQNGTSAAGAGSAYPYFLKSLVKTDGTEWTATAINGGESYSYQSLGAFLAANNTNNYPNTTFAIGSGNTPFANTDYELATPITTGFSITLSAIHYNDGNDLGSLEYTIVINNTSADTLTINEIGIKKEVRSSSSNHPPFLLARAVLESPLEISAGSSKALTAKISMPLTAPSA